MTLFRLWLGVLCVTVCLHGETPETQPQLAIPGYGGALGALERLTATLPKMPEEAPEIPRDPLIDEIYGRGVFAFGDENILREEALPADQNSGLESLLNPAQPELTMPYLSVPTFQDPPAKTQKTPVVEELPLGFSSSRAFENQIRP